MVVLGRLYFSNAILLVGLSIGRPSQLLLITGDMVYMCWKGSRKWGGGVVLFVHRFTQRDSYRSFPLGLLNSFQVVSYVLLQAERRSLAAAGPVITLFPLRCIWASLEAIAFCSSVSMTP